MKRMVLGLSLSLAALVFLMPPAIAEPSPDPASAVLSVADQAFLASLAARAGTPAPELAAKRRVIGQKSYCSATANCASGTVSCSGNSSCTAVDGNCPSEQGHVTCDGVTTSCSACMDCGDPYFCADQEANCASRFEPCSYIFSCNASTCTTLCHQGSC
jgi:hypothetical protein